ncbi:MAG TPA: hypothetical protein VK622_10005, partial [Puia sp.]|nr:hypothetical protein [Puia sp.]
MKIYERDIRKWIRALRLSLFIVIFLISVSIGYHRSDYTTVLLFLFVCLSIIPVVNLQVFHDKIQIERLFFFG